MLLCVGIVLLLILILFFGHWYRAENFRPCLDCGADLRLHGDQLRVNPFRPPYSASSDFMLTAPPSDDGARSVVDHDAPTA